ncbi:MAG: bifunctional (p)ppGpp synthetase/guanosine-3',5'-bis(diphosphate) 3'-pyrophosphohydrolase [Gammaproteobacteria bacterium]|nr:bifunctional (p)ppGpp synthetase/guanosine-3',5'-bis(diphosphate) 3'-pyrophosphohydrolase [Gammaproteobacteria bacterium]
MNLLLRAAAFAADKHRNQRRKDHARTPYINHPLAVARVLAEEGGVTDVEILAAAILHDTLEDTETTPRELHREFGARVAALVAEVTDDKSLPKQQRKQLQVEHAPTKSKGAALIKVADKICNLRDLRGSPPKHWSEERRRKYRQWAGVVVAALPIGRHRLRRVAAIYRQPRLSGARPWSLPISCSMPSPPPMSPVIKPTLSSTHSSIA